MSGSWTWSRRWGACPRQSPRHAEYLQALFDPPKDGVGRPGKGLGYNGVKSIDKGDTSGRNIIPRRKCRYRAVEYVCRRKLEPGRIWNKRAAAAPQRNASRSADYGTPSYPGGAEREYCDVIAVHTY